MSKMVCAIVGYGDTSWSNAEDLLIDLWPADVCEVRVLVPADVKGMPGVKTVIDWMDAVEQDYESVGLPELILTLNHDKSDIKYLIVVGPEQVETIIQAAWDSFIPVLNLAEGLDEIGSPLYDEGSDMLLQAPVSHADSLTDSPGGSVRVEDSSPVEKLTEAQLSQQTTWTVDQLKELIVNEIRIHERLHHKDREVVAGDSTPVKAEDSAGTKYYVNGKGTHRKAGRSKIKAGEKEVWLTEEEIAALP